MRLSLATALIGAATTVSAAVNIGTLNGYHLGWYQGSDPCSGVYIAPTSDNPCGKKFKYSGHEYEVSLLLLKSSKTHN
jgi:hypothetical protein